MRKLVEDEFRRGASIPVVPFPRDGAEIPDTPRLTLVVADPEAEWSGSWLAARAARRVDEAAAGSRRGSIRGARLVPQEARAGSAREGGARRSRGSGSRVRSRKARSAGSSTATTAPDLQSKVKDAEEAAKDEVWGDYRFAVLADGQEADGLKVIDLGAGHSSSGETLCGRVIAALKSEALLNESVGAGLHRAQLAAGAEGVRGVAAGEPAAELPQRLADAPCRSRRDPEDQDRRVRRAR